MSSKEKDLKKLIDAVRRNNWQEFYSCVERLEIQKYGYAFTNIRQNINKDIWFDWVGRINNLKSAIQLGKNHYDAFMNIYIFLYMYPMIVVEEFFFVRKNESMRDKAYNEFVRRLEDGLDLLCSSTDPDRTHEIRELQKTYYERFVHSIIRNCETNLELKFNLLSHVYAFAKYYQDDPDDERCLNLEVIENCFIKNVFAEYKENKTFQDILSRRNDGKKRFWADYRQALVNFGTSERTAQEKPQVQIGAGSDDYFEGSPGKPSYGDEETSHDEGASYGVWANPFPTVLSRCIALLCIVSLVFNAFLLKKLSSPVKVNDVTGDVTVGTEHDSSTSSEIRGKSVSDKSRDDSSVAGTGTEFDDSSTAKSLDESKKDGEMTTNDDSTSSLRYLTIAQGDENDHRNLRSTPRSNETDNILVQIQSGEKVRIIEELDESWVYVEYITTVSEDDIPYEYGYRGYVYRMPGDIINEK